jgi:hypothetical protein
MTRVEGKRHGIRSRRNGLGQRKITEKNNLAILVMAKGGTSGSVPREKKGKQDKGRGKKAASYFHERGFSVLFSTSC